MLEGPTFLVSRELPTACEQESNWTYNAFCVTSLSKSKTSKPSEGNLVISHSEPNNSNTKKQQDANNHSDSTSLINQIGLDLTINCLLHNSRSDYGSIASLNRKFRTLIRNGELYKLRRKMGIIEHWIYFSCNLFKWEAFDPIRHRWMRLPTMDCNECFMCSDKESLAVGTELLVFGKEIDTNVVYKYSILTNSWSPGIETTTPRCLSPPQVSTKSPLSPAGVLRLVRSWTQPSFTIQKSGHGRDWIAWINEGKCVLGCLWIRNFT